MNSSVSKKVDQIVARALARDPNARYSSAKTMALDLESALHEMRYFSQRLPSFLKELFKDEVTESKDRILPKEIVAISAAMAEPVAGPPVEPTGTDDLLSGQASAPVQAWQWVAATNQRKVGAGVGVGLLAAVLTFGVFRGGSRTEEVPVASKAVVPTAAAPKPAAVQISIDSFPQGAQITSAGGVVLGKTPVTLEFPPARQEVKLTLSLEGFVPALVGVITDIDKPIFTKLDAVVAVAQPKPVPQKRSGNKKRRSADIPLDPFAE